MKKGEEPARIGEFFSLFRSYFPQKGDVPRGTSEVFWTQRRPFPFILQGDKNAKWARKGRPEGIHQASMGRPKAEIVLSAECPRASPGLQLSRLAAKEYQTPILFQFFLWPFCGSTFCSWAPSIGRAPRPPLGLGRDHWTFWNRAVPPVPKSMVMRVPAASSILKKLRNWKPWLVTPPKTLPRR